MSIKPINSIVKEHVQQLLFIANEKAEKKYNGIECNLQSYEHFDQLKSIIQELKDIQSIIEKSEYQFYIEYHSNEDWLINQFSSRAFLLNINESEQFEEAVILGILQSKLFVKKLQLTNEIPIYTYSDFIAGKIDPYFANFEQEHNLAMDEFYKIRCWQAENLFEIINNQSQNLIRRMQERCLFLDDPMQFIMVEKEKIDSKIRYVEPVAKEIISALSELYVFNNFPINGLNDLILEECYLDYKLGKMNWKYIFPKYLYLIGEGRKDSCGFEYNEVTIFLILNKLRNWFELVLNGYSVQQELEDSNWAYVFENILASANIKVKVLIEDILKYVNDPDISNDKKKEFLIDNLDIYRKRFNEFEDKQYFSKIFEGDNELLRITFISNSYFGNEFAKQQKKLTDALIIYEMAWEIVQLYKHFFESYELDLPNSEANYMNITTLMYHMVLDKDIYSVLRNSEDNFIQCFESCSLPTEIYQLNEIEMYKELFDKSLNRLVYYLNEADSSNKILYLQSRIKQLRLIEFEYMKSEEGKFFFNDELKYFKLFKEFLEIESDFVSSTKDLRAFNYLLQQPIETKGDELKSELIRYNFLELPLVKQLKPLNQEKLFNLILKNQLPYAIAMFDHLGFIKYLLENHFESKYSMNIEISKWFKSDKEGRAVKGNISSLLMNSKQKNGRYTAYQHKKQVVNDYEKLK